LIAAKPVTSILFSSIQALNRSNADGLRVTLHYGNKIKDIKFSSSSALDTFQELLSHGSRFQDRPSIISSYITPQLSIWIGTWNTGGTCLFHTSWIACSQHDLVVIGLQECKYRQQWTSAISTHLSDQYDLFHKDSLWEMIMLIFVRRSQIALFDIALISKDTIGTGAGHLGNKGAVLASLRLQQSIVSLTCTHLAARPERLLNRRENLMRIIKDAKPDIYRDARHHIIFGNLAIS
jgi:hypothetical protein